MKTLISAAALAVISLAATPALATLDCGPMSFAVGESGRNPVAHTTVHIDTNGWTIVHHMQDGRDYDRGAQYTGMINQPRNDNVLEWSGIRTSRPNLEMHGMVFESDGRVWYRETIIDHDRRNRTVADTTQDCGPARGNNPPPVVAAVPTPDAPVQRDFAGNPLTVYTPAAPQGDSIPMIYVHGAGYVGVQLGGVGTTMLVDTGANVMSVRPTLAAQLVGRGDATWGENTTSVLADGREVTEPSILISSITVGSHRLSNVMATVTPSDDAMQLLGLPVLNRIGKFTVDAANQLLSFN